MESQLRCQTSVPAKGSAGCDYSSCSGSVCCWLCLQAGGGHRAGAVATVVAAVDLARVRQPLQVEQEPDEQLDILVAASRTPAKAQAGLQLTAQHLQVSQEAGC